MAVAETLRDIRAGIVTHSHAYGNAGAPAQTPRSQGRSAGVLAGPCSDYDARDRDRRDADTEHLVEFDRSETIHWAPFREVVEAICAEVGATVDWDSRRIEAPALHFQPLQSRSPEPGP